MSRYATVTAEVDVEVCISEFDTEDLIDELEKRGRSITFSYFQNQLLTKIWQLRREGRDYQKELDDLIYQTLGKII